MPDTFLTCSADGTVHLIDLRQRYTGQTSTEFKDELDPEEMDRVAPQAFGGGRRGKVGSFFADLLLR
jgi:hypothetical protein